MAPRRLAVLSLLSACSSPAGGPPPLVADWSRDLVRELLSVDLAAREGTATVQLAAGAALSTSFATGGLEIREVTDLAGAAVEWMEEGGILTFATPSESVDFVIHYRFDLTDDAVRDGGLHEGGATLTWPDHCGALFPCRPDPAEGAIYELEIEGSPQGETTVFAESSGAPMPAYALAWSTGSWTERDVGQTPTGTGLRAWSTEGSENFVQSGLEDTVAALAWLEEQFGPQPFGDELGVVESAALPPGAMEHAPAWHVHPGVWRFDEVHAHEAAHMWFGNSLRIACWEDIVLAEGVVKWLETTIRGSFEDPSWEATRWEELREGALGAQAEGDHVLRPAGCGQADASVLLDTITYNKGAWFFRTIELQLGRAVLLSGLAAFYDEYQGQAATVDQLVESLGSHSGTDLVPLSNLWLRGLGWPDPLISGRSVRGSGRRT